MIKEMAILASLLAMVVGAPMTSHAAPPYEAANEPYWAHRCIVHDGDSIAFSFPPPSGEPCSSAATADAAGRGSGNVYLNGDHGRYGSGFGEATFRLTFDVPRQVAELPIEVRLKVNSASASVEEAPGGSSSALFGVNVWLRQDPICDCDMGSLLAEKTLLSAGRGEEKFINDQEVVINTVLRRSEPLQAGTYSIDVEHRASAYINFPSIEARASFDISLVEVRIAGHRSFVASKGR